MKTFYVLWIIVCSNALLSVGVSSLCWLAKVALCFLILTAAWQQVARFRIKSVNLQHGKILVREGAEMVAAVFKPTSVVTRYLCFLHLQALDSTKSWCLPVSRLEFSQKEFRHLKSNLQRFVMSKN